MPWNSTPFFVEREAFIDINLRKAAVVGASGQIGGWLVHLLKRRGISVVGTFANVPYDGLEQLDSSDHAAARAWVKRHRPDLIFYPAGWTWVDGCEKDPERARSANVLDPLNIAETGYEYGARFVYYSTDYVFDGTDGPNSETDTAKPLSVYGQVKLEGENRLFERLGNQLLCLRTAWVQGPERQGKNFAYQVWRNLSQNKTMICPSDQISNPTYGPDLANLSIVLAMAGESGIWNVAGPDLWARDALGREIAKKFDLDPNLIIGKPTSELNQPAARPLQGGLTTTKLQAKIPNALHSLHQWLDDFKEKCGSTGDQESGLPIRRLVDL